MQIVLDLDLFEEEIMGTFQRYCGIFPYDSFGEFIFIFNIRNKKMFFDFAHLAENLKNEPNQG